MNSDAFEQGFAFPLRVDASGRIAVSTWAQKIRESIMILLGTQHGERLMRPNFGCNLKSLLFAPNSRATAELARYYIEEALATWEPRIMLEEVKVENDYQTGCLMIEVRYQIKATHEAQRLTVPFFLDQG
jgi:hypothetical protein